MNELLGKGKWHWLCYVWFMLRPILINFVNFEKLNRHPLKDTVMPVTYNTSIL